MFFSKLFSAVATPSGVEVDLGDLFVQTYDFKRFKSIDENGASDYIKVTAPAKKAMQEIVSKIDRIADKAGYNKSIVIWCFKLKADSKFKYNIVELSGFESSSDDVFGYMDYYADREYTPADFEADLEILGYSFKQMKNASLIELQQAEVDMLFKEILSDKPQKVDMAGIVLNPDGTLQGWTSDTRYLEFSSPIKAKRGSNLGELARLMKEYTQRKESGSYTIGYYWDTGGGRPKKNLLKPFEIIFYGNGDIKFCGLFSNKAPDVNKIIPDSLGYYVEAPDTEWDYALRVVGGMHDRVKLTLENTDEFGKMLVLSGIGEENRMTQSGIEKFSTNIKIPKGEDAIVIFGVRTTYLNYGLKYTNTISFQKADGLPAPSSFCMSDRFVCMPVIL